MQRNIWKSFVVFFFHKYMYVTSFFNTTISMFSLAWILVKVSLAINVYIVCKSNCNARQYLYYLFIYLFIFCFLLIYCFSCTVSTNTNKAFNKKK